ncbi:hypothetical protein [Prosthecobacter sp.]|uniref:hypothetical protein n=1 Tax=Prosthecobacter sp. TaxID=1965333 RepID=UPI003783C9A0
MKKHFIIFFAAAAGIATTALGADSVDVMLRKIFGSEQPPLAPPLALTSHALVGKDNSIAVSAWNGALVFEGSTFDGFQTSFAFADPTADRSVKFANASGTVFLSTLATNAPDAANGVWGASNGLSFEGATADAYETTVSVTDPTADRTITIPNGSGTVGLQATSALTSATTISVTPGSSVSAYTLTPAHTATINAVTTGAIAGRAYYLVVTTSGSSSYTLTFGTAFKTTGTLASGTSSGKVFVIHFIFDGTNFNEVSRTTAM